MASLSLSGAHILVAGGAGFIGSNFVHRLMRGRADVRVTVLDLLSYAGNPANLADFREEPLFTLIQGDIADEDTVGPLVGEADFVVNFAAETHVDRSINDQSHLLRSNIEGPLCLLNAIRKHPIKRFIQIGTDEVYGEILGDPVTESAPLRPRNPYSASKAAADGMAMAYHATYELPILITRCSNNYGPYQYPEKMIPLFATNAMEDKPLPVYGTGTNTRDWIHVEDHARAIEMLLLADGNDVDGELFNIAGGNEYSVLDISDRILKALDKPESLIEHVTDRPGHDRRYALNADKIAQAIGFKPKKGLRYRSWGNHWLVCEPQRLVGSNQVSGAFRDYYKDMYNSR